MSFDRTKGYGFVAADSGGEDVFVHVNDLLVDKSLMMPGSIVEFRVEEGDRGPKASSVSVVAPAAREAAGSRTGGDLEGEDLCDVLSVVEFDRELTEALLRAQPTLTGAQILDVRERMRKLAQSHSWVDR